MRRLVDMNVVGNVGTLSGPAIAGTLAVIGLPLALATGVVAAVIGAALSVTLHALPPFDRSRSAGTLALIGKGALVGKGVRLPQAVQVAPGARMPDQQAVDKELLSLSDRLVASKIASPYLMRGRA